MKILRFIFTNTDGYGQNVDLFVGVDNETWNRTSVTKNQIDDAIASYIESVEDWQYEELITEVLKSFDLDFEFVDITTFLI